MVNYFNDKALNIFIVLRLTFNPIENPVERKEFDIL